MSSVVLLIGSVSTYQMWGYYITGKLWWYLIGVAVVIVFVLLRWKIGGFKFYLHHYQIGIIIISLSQWEGVISMLILAIGQGLYIEGVARWGHDTLLQI